MESKLLGFIPSDKERLVIFASAIAGLALFIIWARSHNSNSASEYPLGYAGGITNAGGLSSDTSVNPSDNISQQVIPPMSFELHYDTDNGVSVNGLIQKITGSSTSGGSAGIGIGSFRIGGSKSSTKGGVTQGYEAEFDLPGKTSFDVGIENASNDTVTSVLEWLKKMSGTTAQNQTNQRLVLGEVLDSFGRLSSNDLPYYSPSYSFASGVSSAGVGESGGLTGVYATVTAPPATGVAIGSALPAVIRTT